jgi:prepilin-type N-terminal cleavage/methylation domain-containing protein
VTRIRGAGGFTLVEVMIVLVLMGLLLASTLSAFATMERNARVTGDTNDLQDQTRLVTDQVARQLRNLASQSDNVFKPIERAKPDDIIFRTVRQAAAATNPTTNPTNIQRVRYCLNSQRRFFSQTQILADATTAAPAGSACPLTGNGWTTQRLLNGSVVNGNRPVFSYMLAGAPPQRFVETSTITDDAQLERVVSVRATFFVDDDLTRKPTESVLNTRVFLRNQNRKPTAAFNAIASGMMLQLNGGDSEDPEGGRLTFEWSDQANAEPIRKIGEGSILNYATSVGTHRITLKVTDPAGNTTSAPAQTFDCQNSTGCVKIT